MTEAAHTRSARTRPLTVGFYRLPRPYESETSELRFYHDDLAGASAMALRCEATAAAATLARLVQADRDPILVCYPRVVTARAWLRGRLGATGREMRAHRTRRAVA